MLVLVMYIVRNERCNADECFHTKLNNTLLFNDKLQLSWPAKLAFKLTNIICVIYGTIQTG